MIAIGSNPSLERRGLFGRRGGFTLVELVIIVAILITLATIATALYKGALIRSRITKAIGDIRTIEGDIIHFYTRNRSYPDSLADVGHGGRHDPWGNEYQYLRFDAAKNKGKMRKDRFLVPLNSDFDLYSMGADGASQPPLTAKSSRDDIVRANDGSYVGPASEF